MSILLADSRRPRDLVRVAFIAANRREVGTGAAEEWFTPSRRANYRDALYNLNAVQRDFSTRRAVRRCGQAGRKCGSALCAACSTGRGSQHRRELMASLGVVTFGHAVMWTATIATTPDRSHKQQHEDLMAVIQATIRGDWLGRRGITGTARVIENERTAAGWHVHAHVLLISRKEFDRGEARAFALDLRTRYLAEAERLGVRASAAGQRVEKAKRVSDLVDYITKGRVRPGGTDAPSALWNAVRGGDGDALALIHDLEAGTFRRRLWTTTGVCRPLTRSR